MVSLIEGRRYQWCCGFHKVQPAEFLEPAVPYLECVESHSRTADQETSSEGGWRERGSGCLVESYDPGHRVWIIQKRASDSCCAAELPQKQPVQMLLAEDDRVVHALSPD